MKDDEKAMLDLGYCFDSEPHLCMASTFCAFRDGPKAEQVLSLEALRAANVARQAAWCPDQQPDLSFRGNELGGECGEAQNVIKKLERERLGWAGSRDTLEHLAEELADVVICADLCAMTAGVDLAGAVVAKFNATSEKVGLPHRLGESAPLSAAARESKRSGWHVEHDLANVEGFGASFSRDDLKWHLYTMPGAKAFGTIDGYDKASIDFVMEALRSHLAALRRPDAPAPVAGQILKGIGKINGDGWKDTTTKGEVVFVWNDERPAPYAPGQYPRIGNEGWSASTAQYDFTPATVEEARRALAALTAGSEPRATDAGEGERETSDAIDLIVRAKDALQRHIDAIQAAKRDGGSAAPITECVNALPEIVRWLDAGQFEIEAAFEEYEDAALRPAAPDADKPEPRDGEAVAWRFRNHPSNGWIYTGLGGQHDGCEVQPLYTHPPAPDAQLSVAVEHAFKAGIDIAYVDICGRKAPDHFKEREWDRAATALRQIGSTEGDETAPPSADAGQP